MKTCEFIDMAVPSNRNTSVKVIEKLSKYKEASRMWGIRSETVSVIIGALRAVKKGQEKYTKKVHWKNPWPNKRQ